MRYLTQKFLYTFASNFKLIININFKKVKKIIFSISLCLIVGFSSMAQDVVGDNPAVTNKRGVAILPQAGDFALGIDAFEPLRYLGNFFSSGGNYAPYFEGIYGDIVGKYFLQNDRALRVRLSLGLNSIDRKAFVMDDSKPTETNFTLEDVQKYSVSDISLGVGYEFRRGKGRVQGFYGGEGVLGFGSSKYKYEYANAITSSRWTPTSTNFNNNVSTIGGITTREIESKNGTRISVGASGFVGAEYFFAPQLSIGGEFALGLNFNMVGKSEITRESWSTANNRVETRTTKGSGARTAMNMGLNTVSYSNIFLMFYF